MRHDSRSSSTHVLVVRWPNTGWTDVVASIDELRIITGANLHGTPIESEEVANAEEAARVWGKWMPATTAWDMRPDCENAGWSAQAIVRLMREFRGEGNAEGERKATNHYKHRHPEMWEVVVDILETEWPTST